MAAVLLHPEEEVTLTQLARRTGVPLSTVHAEASRLIVAGILAERAVGRARLVRANTGNRVVRPLTELVALTFGPIEVVTDEFGEIDGVEQVIVFGSWAARFLGESGPPPQDVDLLVVGSPDRSGIYEAADRVEQRTAFPVHPVVVSLERFVTADTPLLRQIAESPTVTVIDRTARAAV
jgi:hypothetical protein